MTCAAELAVIGAAFMLAIGQALVGSQVEHDRPWTPPLRIGKGCKFARSKSRVPPFPNFTQVSWRATLREWAAVPTKPDLIGQHEFASDVPIADIQRIPLTTRSRTLVIIEPE
jgi:hypothetical protein